MYRLTFREMSIDALDSICDTNRRIGYVVQMLNEGIVFQVHYLYTFGGNVDYGIEEFRMSKINGERAVYPQGLRPFGGGSYHTLDLAARKIVQLVRDNHRIQIEDIWKETRELRKKKGYVVEIGWAINMNISNNETMPDGKIENFFDELEKLFEREKNSTAIGLENLLENIKEMTMWYQMERKLFGRWDHDSILLPKRIIKPNKYHIKDLIAALKSDNLEKMKEIYSYNFLYRSFLFDINYHTRQYRNDDYGNGCNYDDRVSDSNALIVCAYNNSKVCMSWLLENGANPNYQNSGGSTALHIAGRYGYIDCVRMLLEHGIDTTLKDNDGLNAYERCLVRKETECAELMKR